MERRFDVAFKQIVGRGTRVHEDSRNLYVTLIDLRRATSQFADPEFDGDPVQIYASGEDDPITPPDEIDEGRQATFEPPEGETVVDQPRLPQTPGARTARSMSMASAPASSPSASRISMRTASSSPNRYAAGYWT